MGAVYDEVRYPSLPVTISHPGHTGAIARLLGFDVAPLQNCRVLEIGCGEGVNIANLAIGAPNSEFVGFDLAASAIARGRAMVECAGLSNVRLSVADLRDISAAPGSFDYIIAHGVYAWIPENARAALMALIGAKLSPRGVAFLSYNAFPGCRDRQTIRDFLRFALRGCADPTERIARARKTLERQIAAWDETDAAQKTLIEAARDNLKRPMELLFHDEMGEHWAPQFLFDVVGAARAYGLDYLADAEPDELKDAIFPSPRVEAALPRTGGDWARFLQFEDFISLRRFRWSLLRRAGAAPHPVATPDRVAGLHVSGDLTAVEGERRKTYVFAYAVEGKRGEIATDDGRLGALLSRIASGETVALDTSDDLAALMEPVLRLFVAGALRLSTEPPLFAREAADKPCASPLARAQCVLGDRVLANLRHGPVEVRSFFARQLLPKLDGTRTQVELVSFAAEASAASIDEARGVVAGTLAAFFRDRLLLNA